MRCVKTTTTTRGEEDATAARVYRVCLYRVIAAARARTRRRRRDDARGLEDEEGARATLARAAATDSDSSRFPREGIGWYAACRCGMVDRHGLDAYCRPAVYTTVAAPSHDRNLRSLSKSLNASLLFGHVRAAGPGASVHQYNCHPFVRGRYMFMHNGDVADFKRIRRSLLAHLRDDLFDQISGTTDSELVFSLILNELPDVYDKYEPKVLEKAVFKAICIIIKANRGQANSINIAITDGETIIATRYRNSATEEPPSLYFHLGPMPGEKAWDLDNAEGLAGFDRLVDSNIHKNTGGPRQRRNPAFQAILQKKIFATQSLLVSSEPLSMTGLGNWQLCPPNCMIVAHPTRPTKGRCTREDLLQSLHNGKRCPDAVTHEPSSPTKRGGSSDSPVLEIEFRCLEELCDTILSFKDGQKTPSEVHLDTMDSRPQSRRTGSLSELESGQDVVTPPRSPTPVKDASSAGRAIAAGGGMLGLSSLSKELRALHDASDDYSDKQVHANSASRVSLDRVDREDSACALRRSHSISSNMAPSSWHEGSKYLRP